MASLSIVGTSKGEDRDSTTRLPVESLMTAPEVGAYLRVPPKKVYDLVGDLAMNLGRRRLRWRRIDLDRWLDEHRRAS
jgi:predicted DNA-binding transcriptional regulator AlpA